MLISWQHGFFTRLGACERLCSYAMDDASTRPARRLCYCHRKQISVREFVRMSAKEVGLELEFSGTGVDEIAFVVNKTSDCAVGVNIGDVIVRVDPRYFRPAEVETLLGDPTKAKNVLGWEPEITVEEMCAEMVASDLEKAKQHALLKSHGFDVAVSLER